MILTLTLTLTSTLTLTTLTTDPHQVRSNWGRVFYTNLWSSILLLFMTLTLEPHVLTKTLWTQEKIAALLLSCALGTAMSYFAFLCRAAVSATSFTVVGNVSST